MEQDCTILELSEKDKVFGHIYKITNTKNNKCYVGQSASHRKNNHKYRPFGYIGRFKDHISEALSNTKKGCTYLNNAIKTYGKDAFIVELLETCKFSEMNDREIYHVKKYNTLYPNGYNLTIGGKNRYVAKCKNIDEYGNVGKRGRDFGYKHKGETIAKMKKYYETVDEKLMEKKKKTMSSTISNHFANKRAETLAKSDIKLDENFEDLIRPYKKNGVLSGYSIRYNRKRYSQIVCNNKYTTEDIYNIYYDALKEAYELRKANKVKITEMSER